MIVVGSHNRQAELIAVVVGNAFEVKFNCRHINCFMNRRWYECTASTLKIWCSINNIPVKMQSHKLFERYIT